MTLVIGLFVFKAVLKINSKTIENKI